jgi:hypothetical protein
MKKEKAVAKIAKGVAKAKAAILQEVQVLNTRITRLQATHQVLDKAESLLAISSTSINPEHASMAMGDAQGALKLARENLEHIDDPESNGEASAKKSNKKRNK